MSNENETPAPVAVKPEAKKPLSIKDRLQSEAFLSEVQKTLPDGFKAEVFARVALNILSKTPALAQCDPVSIMRCVLDCAALGITPDGRRAYLIPYKTTCTLVVSYQGLVELVRRSGLVSTIHADVVCENDVFTESLGQITEHKIDRKGELAGKARGAVYAVYALVTLKDGSQQSVVMSVSEVEKIRKNSNSVKSGRATPWDGHWDEMAKKTAVRRLCKMLTLSPEIQDAAAKDDEDFVDIQASRKPAGRPKAVVEFEALPVAIEGGEESNAEAGQ